jgi:acyl carrier protein
MDQVVRRFQVSEKVRIIIATELENEHLSIEDSSMIGELPHWDSVAHFRIMVALENEFAILFDFEEHSDFETVGQVVDCICAKLQRK